MSVVRGGRPLLRKRGNLAAAGMTEAQWRGQWESARLFLIAGGENDKLPASQRDGRLRAAISAVIGLARERGCQAVVIEDLDFAAAREQGRERRSGRPSRGRRGRSYRALVAGRPTARFRDRLVQMAANAGLAVIAVDAAYTSRWGAEHWLGPLQERHSPIPASGHHAAAVVIGRRALGHRARRRAGVTGGGQRTSRRIRPPDQAAQDRPGPPTSQDYVLLLQKERLRWICG